MRIFLIIFMCGLGFISGCKNTQQDTHSSLLSENQAYAPLHIMLVDLDGDGPDIVPLERSPIFYDVEGNGHLKRTAWVGTDDAFMRILTMEYTRTSGPERDFITLDVNLDLLRSYDLDKDSVLNFNEIYKNRRAVLRPNVWHGPKLKNIFDQKRPDLNIKFREMFHQISIDKECSPIETINYRQVCKGFVEWRSGEKANFYIMQFAYETQQTIQ